jgi:hypothetical protein
MSAQSRIKTAGMVVVALAAALLLVRYFIARSALTIVYAGGTAESPRVLATNVDIDRTRRDSRFADTKLQMLVFGAESSEPLNTISVPGAPRPVGAKGSKLWMTVGQRPFLVDLDSAKVVHSIGALEERHVPLSQGFKATSGHSEFSRGVDPKSGALQIEADNGLPFLLKIDGSLVPWEEYIAEHPSSTELVCRGGRERLCGTETCMKFEPSQQGGVALAIGSDSESAAKGEALISPELVGNEGCVRGLTDANLIVINHQSAPGKGKPRDLITAFDTSAKTVWSVSVTDLFGDRALDDFVVGLGDGVVVVGAVVSHWLYGKSVITATIDPDGTPHPAPA